MDVVGNIDAAMRIEMIVGAQDNVTPPDLTERYSTALKERDIAVRVITLPNKGHEILLDAAVLRELANLIRSL